MLSHRLRHIIASHCPPLCHLCGLSIEEESTSGKTIWCHHCLAYFASKPRCQKCGLETPMVVPTCGDCLSEPPLWHRLYCVGNYQPPLSAYINRLKYTDNHQYGVDLTYLLAMQITEPAPLITCVPLHWSRFIQRGYNQSALLGHYLCHHLKNHSQFESTLFSRIKKTPSQQGLKKNQRLKNLKHAFTLNRAITQTHVAIIDDVVTTGSTVRQLCQLLLDVGVKKIDIYCICRTEK